jgi:hypothetical protein
VRLFRRERPPAAALAPLDRDERVVSWGSTPDGAAVVATPLGLWLPGPDAPERLPWHLVDKATWRDGRLTVTPAVDAGDGVLDEQPPRSVRLATPRDLPQTVRVRVERAIAYTRHHRLPGGGGVRVVGRRVPGRDGVSWQLVFDTGVDRDDPAVRAAAAARVDEARAEIGL